MDWFLVGIVIAFLVSVVVFVALPNRPQRDRPGQRTVATFVAPWYWDGLAAESPETALVHRLHDALGERGVELERPRRPRSHGRRWTMSGRDLQVTVKVDGELGGRWVLRVLGSSGGPGPIAAARVIDDVLRTLPEVTALRWHRREDPLSADEGHEHPTGD